MTKDTTTLDDVCCDEDAARDSSGNGKVRRDGWLAVEWSSGDDDARSLFAIPGLWLLSLALAGAKKRGDGNLSLPIGLRTGILTANFVLQTSGFLTYRSNAPFWLTGIHPWQPFGGIVGLTFCVALAILLYPQQPRQRKKPRVIFD